MKLTLQAVLNQAIKANLMMKRAIKAAATTTAMTGITVDKTIVCDDPGGDGEITGVCGSVDINRIIYNILIYILYVYIVRKFSRECLKMFKIAKNRIAKMFNGYIVITVAMNLRKIFSAFVILLSLFSRLSACSYFFWRA